MQDVVLPTPSVFEENMLSTLSSFIFFNKVSKNNPNFDCWTLQNQFFYKFSSPTY